MHVQKWLLTMRWVVIQVQVGNFFIDDVLIGGFGINVIT
jgi:hypothetical protein